MDVNTIYSILNTSNNVIKDKPIINIPMYKASDTIFHNVIIEPKTTASYESQQWQSEGVSTSRAVSETSTLEADNAHKHHTSNTLKRVFKRLYNLTKDKQITSTSPNMSHTSASNHIIPAMNFEDYKKITWHKSLHQISEEKPKYQLLIDQIETYKKKLTKDYFIISVKYDKICYKYNAISLTIMILSTVSTFIEAVRLTLTEYMKSNRDSMIVDVDVFTLTINVFMLLLGTVITILSSIVRFKNYREIMEKLKNIQNMILKYVIIYNKQIDLIQSYNLKGDMDADTFNIFQEKIKEYNKEINDNINILEDIRNDDVIKLEQYQHKFDIKLEEMKKLRELELLKLNNRKDIQMAILNNLKDVELFKLENKKNKNLKDLDYIKEEYEKHKYIELTKLNNSISLQLQKLKTAFDNKVSDIYGNMTHKNNNDSNV